MSAWLWVNIGLSALFVLAWSGIPLWMVLRRADIGPDAATPLTARPAHALAREATGHAWRTARLQPAMLPAADSRRRAA